MRVCLRQGMESRHQNRCNPMFYSLLAVNQRLFSVHIWCLIASVPLLVGEGESSTPTCCRDAGRHQPQLDSRAAFAKYTSAQTDSVYRPVRPTSEGPGSECGVLGLVGGWCSCCPHDPVRSSNHAHLMTVRTAMDVFALGRLSSFDDESERIVNVAFSPISQCVAAIVVRQSVSSSSCSLLVLHLDDEDLSEQRMEWFLDEAMACTCLCFTATGQEVVVFDTNLNNAFTIRVEKSVCQRIKRRQLRGVNNRLSRDIVRTQCCVWWAPAMSSSRSNNRSDEDEDDGEREEALVFVGTDNGRISIVDMHSGKELRSVKISEEGIDDMALLKDNLGDATYLIVSDVKRCQFRVLIEQRSSGYVIVDPNYKISMTLSDHCNKQTSSRTSWRPISGLMSLRQRLSDTSRRLLDRRLSSMSSSSSISSGSTSSLVIDNDYNDQAAMNRRLSLGGLIVEPLRRRVGNTWVDVQTSVESIHLRNRVEKRCSQIVTGLLLENAMLTLHNGELEVLSQSALKMPRGVNKVLLQQSVVVAVSENNSRHDVASSYGNINRSQIHLLCRSLAEVHADNGQTSSSDNSLKREPLIQSFGLDIGEEILALYETTSTPKCLHPRNSKEPSLLDKAPMSECQRRFKDQVLSDMESLRERTKGSYKPCLIVTNKAVYLLHLQTDPLDIFMVHADPTLSSKMLQCERLAKALNLDFKFHLQLLNNLLLVERQFTRCVALSRYCGLSHLNLVLRLAQAGCVAQIVSYVDILFRSSNVDLSERDKTHCSNLALMASFHQLLAKKTRTEKQSFLNKVVKPFIESNVWFDSSIAVQLCIKNNEWQTLGNVCRQRGVARQSATMLLDTLLPQNQKEQQVVSLQHLRNSRAILHCLLSRDVLLNVLDEPVLRDRYINALHSLMPLLNDKESVTVTKSVSFINGNLDPFLVSLLMDRQYSGKKNDRIGELRLFGKKVVILTVDFCLSFLNRRASGDVISTPLCQREEQSLVPSMLLTDEFECPSELGGERKYKVEPSLFSTASSILGTGHTHSVRVTRSGRVMTWGSNLQGVLGSECPSRHYSQPSTLSFFKDLRLRVASVAVGKQHNLVLTSVGSVYAWGSNRNGQLGIASRSKMQLRPALVALKRRIVAIAAGQFHSLAIDEMGNLYTWGWGVYGQLGHGSIEDELRPRRVATFETCSGDQLDPSNVIVVRAVGGYAHSLVLSDVGKVYVFGCGLFGQMGNDLKGKLSRPRQVLGIDQPVKLIEAGFFHNVVVTKSHQVFTWGCNPQLLRLEAQLAKRRRLQQEQGQKGEKRTRNVVEGNNRSGNSNNDLFRKSHSLLRDLKRQVKQALEDMEQGGHIANGQLPNSDETAIDALEGLPVNTNGDVADKEEHNPKATTTTTTTNPTPMTATPTTTTTEDVKEQRHMHPCPLSLGSLDSKWVSSIRALSCGNQHSLFLLQNGQVYSMGRNMDGQLGLGDRKERSVPTLLSSLSRLSSIDSVACGSDFSLAVNNDDGLTYGWGNNAAGQLGRQPEAEPSSKSTTGTTNTNGGADKSMMMRTTRHIIRLQNNLHNTSDTPKAITVDKDNVVYAQQKLDDDDDDEDDDEETLEQERQLYTRIHRLRSLTRRELNSSSQSSNIQLRTVELLLNLTVETFYEHLDPETTIDKCLKSNQSLLATKLCVLYKDPLRGLELTLKMLMEQKLSKEELETRLFDVYKFFLQSTQSKSLHCGLTQRLIGCWQEQKLDFRRLEILFNEEDDVATRSLVETLFVGMEKKGEGNKLVLSKLFSPEFCLKTSDRFVSIVDEEECKDFLRRTAKTVTNNNNVYTAT